MVVIVKGIAQFKFVFPAKLEPLHNAQLFEEGNGAVDAGTINLRTGLNDLLQGLWLFVLQGGKDDLPGLRQALLL